jgi:microcystin degradation protein MlrC
VTTTGNSGRTPKGTFAPGNRIAKGNPASRRQHELAVAVREAITVDELQAILAKLRDLALAGDTTAAALLLSHAIGKPREAPAVVADLDLDGIDLATAAGIAAALQAILRAAANGSVPIDVCDRLAAIVERTANAGVWEQLADANTDRERLRRA